MEQLKLTFFIRRTRKLSNGECPIYCRLTMNGKRAEFAVNKSVDENIWIPAAGRAKGNSITIFRLNKHLEKIVEDINEIVRQFELPSLTVN